MTQAYSPFISGELCYLRGLLESDLEGAYFHWLNDPQVTRYMNSGRTPNTPQDMQAFFTYTRGNLTNVAFAICDQQTHQHIGNVTLNNMHPIHRRADLGILIGEKAFWGRGYGTEATALTVDYGFKRLNLHSIWLGVVATHVGAIRAYEKAGFKQDGVAREAFWTDGNFHDIVQMSILAREYYERQP